MSTSILEGPTPFHEVNWRQIQTGTKHVSEEIIPENLEAPSNSSGNKSKEAKASAGVASETCCGICLSNHVDAVCPFRKYVETKKYCCDICYGEHLHSVCSFREFVPEGATVSPLYSITCSICGTVISKEQQKCPRCKPKPGCTLIRIATPNVCRYCDDYRHEEDDCPHQRIETFDYPDLDVDEYIDSLPILEPTSPPPMYESEEEP